ncbi:hypothetical protein [Saccharopolyspora spinosa]|uniref:hypothetical protein n=1 Tax=Saccharopolyspora spinosa TaxID=60894 RepID=UPI00376EF781
MAETKEGGGAVLGGKAAAARVVELEELKEQGPLTEEQEAELAELQPKAQKWKKRKEWEARTRVGKVAAARVAELEELAEQAADCGAGGGVGGASAEGAAEAKKKAKDVNYHREVKAAADRVVELEALAERGPLTVEQEAELAELQPKAQQWKKKKEETGNGTGQERLLLPVLRSWRSWRSRGR